MEVARYSLDKWADFECAPSRASRDTEVQNNGAGMLHAAQRETQATFT
jgi:hypothetical protein